MKTINKQSVLKTFTLFGIYALIIHLCFIFHSCEKDKISFESKVVNKASCNQTLLLDTFTLINDFNYQSDTNLYEINAMLLNHLNLLLYKYTDPIFKKNIEEMLEKKDINGIRLSELNDPDFKHFPPVLYKGVNYSGGLFLYNKDKCDFNLAPILTVGIELNNLSENEISNYIIGYYLYADNFKYMPINEKIADSVKNPLFIINPISGDFDPKESQIALNSIQIMKEDEKASLKSNKQINNDAMNIFFQALDVNHRFENSKYSEIYIAHYFLESEFNYIQMMPTLHSKLGEIHKDNIPGTFIKEYKMRLRDHKNTFDRPISSEFSYELAVVTYEYDWYATPKSVFVTPNGSTIYCKMANNNEYYQAGSIHIQDNTWPIGIVKTIISKGNAYFCRYVNN
jgi:hypothetical protein